MISRGSICVPVSGGRLTPADERSAVHHSLPFSLQRPANSQLARGFAVAARHEIGGIKPHPAGINVLNYAYARLPAASARTPANDARRVALTTQAHFAFEYPDLKGVTMPLVASKRLRVTQAVSLARR